MTKTEKQLARILAELEGIANDLEERGLNSLSDILDEAGAKVEDTAAALESL